MVQVSSCSVQLGSGFPWLARSCSSLAQLDSNVVQISSGLVQLGSSDGMLSLASFKLVPSWFRLDQVFVRA